MALEVRIKKKLDNFILDISFTAENGCTGILGASGSSKSMMLKCIAGIETPDEGYIALDDRVLFDSANHINLKPQERKVGYMFQNYALFPNMTVEENLSVAQAADSDDGTSVSNMLYLFGIENLRKQYPEHLSGGEQQRVALARMLLSKPQMLLFDEPFSAMDSFLREGLQTQLSKVMREFGGISLLVTHSRDEVYKLSDMLMILDTGHRIEFGTTKALFETPQDLVTARLTGCKNISAVEIGSSVYAVDWDISFQVETELLHEKQLLGTIKYIGIRAHDFMTQPSEYGTVNRLEIQIMEIQEAPFEWNVMFAVNDTKCKKTLWWKVSKEQIKARADIEQIGVLYLNSEKIMILK